MKLYKHTQILLLLLFLNSTYSIAQETDPTDPVNAEQPVKKFHAGLYIGSYWANNYTASNYDGYGFNIDGVKNDFLNSQMYQKIVMEYGGGYGQPDVIAQELNVDHKDWSFTESDMPVNMHYTPAFLIGLNCRYAITPKNIIILNANAAKLNLTGNFTIYTKPPSNSTQINKSILTFPIIGQENRLLLQLGYQRIVGDNEKLNFFYEIGFLGTFAQFEKNSIAINNIQIDLTSYYNQAQYPTPYPVKKLTGFGLGIFGGGGINLSVNPQWTLQFLYTPTFENVNVAVPPRLKLHHAFGLRGYFNL